MHSKHKPLAQNLDTELGFALLIRKKSACLYQVICIQVAFCSLHTDHVINVSVLHRFCVFTCDCFLDNVRDSRSYQWKKCLPSRSMYSFLKLDKNRL